MMGLNMIHLYLEGVPRIQNLLILMLKLIKVGLNRDEIPRKIVATGARRIPRN